MTFLLPLNHSDSPKGTSLREGLKSLVIRKFYQNQRMRGSAMQQPN